MFSGVTDSRFTLRMLEPNEYYFDDYSVDYYPAGIEDGKRVQGTIKVCSRSLVFVPSNKTDPLLRIRQRDTSEIEAYHPFNSNHLLKGKVRVTF